MKIIIESTDYITHLPGIEGRLWKGTTESGIKVDVLVIGIGVDVDEDRKDEFFKELHQIQNPINHS